MEIDSESNASFPKDGIERQAQSVFTPLAAASREDVTADESTSSALVSTSSLTASSSDMITFSTKPVYLRLGHVILDYRTSVRARGRYSWKKQQKLQKRKEDAEKLVSNVQNWVTSRQQSREQALAQMKRTREARRERRLGRTSLSMHSPAHVRDAFEEDSLPGESEEEDEEKYSRRGPPRAGSTSFLQEGENTTTTTPAAPAADHSPSTAAEQSDLLLGQSLLVANALKAQHGGAVALAEVEGVAESRTGQSLSHQSADVEQAILLSPAPSTSSRGREVSRPTTTLTRTRTLSDRALSTLEKERRRTSFELRKRARANASKRNRTSGNAAHQGQEGEFASSAPDEITGSAALVCRENNTYPAGFDMSPVAYPPDNIFNVGTNKTAANRTKRSTSLRDEHDRFSSRTSNGSDATSFSSTSAGRAANYMSSYQGKIEASRELAIAQLSDRELECESELSSADVTEDESVEDRPAQPQKSPPSFLERIGLSPAQSCGKRRGSCGRRKEDGIKNKADIIASASPSLPGSATSRPSPSTSTTSRQHDSRTVKKKKSTRILSSRGASREENGSSAAPVGLGAQHQSGTAIVGQQSDGSQELEGKNAVEINSFPQSQNPDDLRLHWISAEDLIDVIFFLIANPKSAGGISRRLDVVPGAQKKNKNENSTSSYNKGQPGESPWEIFNAVAPDGGIQFDERTAIATEAVFYPEYHESLIASSPSTFLHDGAAAQRQQFCVAWNEVVAGEMKLLNNTTLEQQKNPRGQRLRDDRPLQELRSPPASLPFYSTANNSSSSMHARTTKTTSSSAASTPRSYTSSSTPALLKMPGNSVVSWVGGVVAPFLPVSVIKTVRDAVDELGPVCSSAGVVHRQGRSSPFISANALQQHNEAESTPGSEGPGRAFSPTFSSTTGSAPSTAEYQQYEYYCAASNSNPILLHPLLAPYYSVKTNAVRPQKLLSMGYVFHDVDFNE
ncbi:unnamed protein product [Amoebophrya sp. A120]|nr:unnamed protein product [Amoebophrya sp. A120]|eukprot:GSA120T00024599001.1